MFIQNVSLSDVKNGRHYDAGENSMLIQIVDPNMEFPKAKCKFRNTLKFKFLDAEDKDDTDEKITDADAQYIIEGLQHALDKHMNVIVHCHAGICRSGAVAEVGVIMGFEDTKIFRQPNLLVKYKLMKVLGLTYE